MRGEGGARGGAAGTREGGRLARERGGGWHARERRLAREREAACTLQLLRLRPASSGVGSANLVWAARGLEAACERGLGWSRRCDFDARGPQTLALSSLTPTPCVPSRAVACGDDSCANS